HHQLDREIVVDPEPPISISHFTHVVRSYRMVILLALAAVALTYTIVALAMYIASPAEQITSLAFRLDFEGAERGEYPNKTKFNIAEIIGGPILTRVWQDDHVGNYIGFGEFSRSVFVLESNRQYEQLAAEYQAKLADPKLSAVDRERVQNEFSLKAQSIAKNEYSINLDRRAGNRTIPDPLARKILFDILNNWATFAVNEQHVITYQISVLSPEILTPSGIEQNDLVASIEVLRQKVKRIMTNIDALENLPGAKLVKTGKDNMSLEEVKLRLDEIVRFRLEPLLARVLHSPNLISDRATTTLFLENQLAYDQRQLDSTKGQADAARDAIAVYEQPNTAQPPAMTTGKTADQPRTSEGVAPQLTDTFLDRLITLSGRSADVQYRQKLVDEYRGATEEMIPLQQAVAYDNQLLEEFRKPSATSNSLTAASVSTEVEQTRSEVAQLINKTNALFIAISNNMTPSTQLFTITGPSATRTIRAASAQRLGLYGVLVLLVTLPVVLIFCLLHNRVREEEATEDFLRQERKMATSQTLP
ncbi:MAG TPA: hypothetical protein VKU62_04310, partial [Thermoanaerobaculia bacterium]|nr:hypothetical protein [Thermoanaerobaculia bacterium]